MVPSNKGKSNQSTNGAGKFWYKWYHTTNYKAQMVTANEGTINQAAHCVPAN
jgi:hypothetical protein